MTVLDAGVLVAVLDSNDAHHIGAVAALRGARTTSDTLVLPASAYAECLVWPFRAGAEAVARMESFIDVLPATVREADRSVARLAAQLRARHGPVLKLPDALVIATAVAVGADRILTTDGGWPQLDIRVDVAAG